jgi:hypothetical protein
MLPLRAADDFVGKSMYIWERRLLRRTIELTSLDDSDRPDAMFATITGRGGQLTARTAEAEWMLKRMRDGRFGLAFCEVWAPTGAEPAATCAWDRPEGAINVAGFGECRWSQDAYSDRLWTVADQAGEVLLRLNDINETGPPYAKGLLRITAAGSALGPALTALVLACAFTLENGMIGRARARIPRGDDDDD